MLPNLGGLSLSKLSLARHCLAADDMSGRPDDALMNQVMCDICFAPLAPPADWTPADALPEGETEWPPAWTEWTGADPKWTVACKNNHIFHKYCLKRTLQVSQKGQVCPECSEPVEPGILGTLFPRPAGQVTPARRQRSGDDAGPPRVRRFPELARRMRRDAPQGPPSPVPGVQQPTFGDTDDELGGGDDNDDAAMADALAGPSDGYVPPPPGALAPADAVPRADQAAVRLAVVDLHTAMAAAAAEARAQLGDVPEIFNDRDSGLGDLVETICETLDDYRLDASHFSFSLVAGDLGRILDEFRNWLGGPGITNHPRLPAAVVTFVRDWVQRAVLHSWEHKLHLLPLVPPEHDPTRQAVTLQQFPGVSTMEPRMEHYVIVGETLCALLPLGRPLRDRADQLRDVLNFLRSLGGGRHDRRAVDAYERLVRLVGRLASQRYSPVQADRFLLVTLRRWALQCLLYLYNDHDLRNYGATWTRDEGFRGPPGGRWRRPDGGGGGGGSGSAN